MENRTDDLVDKTLLICPLMNSLIDSIERYNPRKVGARQDSKESIKRKITMLREELLDLSKMF